MTAPTARRVARYRAEPDVKLLTERQIAELPDRYAIRCQGDCLEPILLDGTMFVFTTIEKPKAGDFVIFWRRPDRMQPGMTHQALIKLLLADVHPRTAFPGRGHRVKDEVTPLLFVEQLNPPRQYAIPCADLLAVHKGIGFTRKGSVNGMVYDKDLLPLPRVATVHVARG